MVKGIAWEAPSDTCPIPCPQPPRSGPPFTWHLPTRATGVPGKAQKGSYLEGAGMVFLLVTLSVLFEGDQCESSEVRGRGSWKCHCRDRGKQMISIRISCLPFLKRINVEFPINIPDLWVAGAAVSGKGSCCRVVKFHPLHPAPSHISEPAKRLNYNLTWEFLNQPRLRWALSQ